MRIGPYDLDRKVLIVAEIGNNHEGDYSRAEELIVRAADAGVDAVKFQTFDPDHYVSRTDTQRIARLRKFRLTADQFAQLAATATRHGVLFFSTPFDLASVDILDPLVPVFKIASGDNTFYPLIRRVAAAGKPIVVSGGLANLEELSTVKRVVYDVWSEIGIDPGLAILHCVANYPVTPEEANLRAIHTLQQLGVTIGYSDHTMGIDASVLAVALGARIIEKHFTLDKNYSDFRDHQLSADPQELELMVSKIRLTEQMLGDGEKVPQPSERRNMQAFRRSIIAAHDLPEGKVLELADLTWVRPGGGMSPGSETAILGRRLRMPVLAGQQLSPEMFV